MEDLSVKAKIIYAALDKLNAKGEENKVTSYALLDFISEDDDLIDHPLLKDVNEQDFMNIIMDLNIKSINALIVSMCRKGIVEKTEPVSMKIDGQRRNLRQYFIK